jgi:hypothetical protein
METVIHQVGDLGKSERSAAEQLVGHALDERQQLVIQIVTPEKSAGANAAEAGDELPEWCDVYAGLSDEEIEALDRAISRRLNLRTAS